MDYWSLYKKRVGHYGNTKRDYSINKFKQDLKLNIIHNPSCKNVLVNGNEMKLVINEGTKPYYKKYTTLPDDIIYSGDIIDWAKTKWLVLNADYDNEVYINGQLQQCNWLLKWQNENGDIIERWVVKSNASAYNSGVEGDKILEVGYDQALLFIPIDKETVKLKRGKRFFIDNDLSDPTPYIITRVDTVSNVSDMHGYITCILTEDQFNKNEDNIELFLCNYKEKIESEYDSTKVSKINLNSNYIMCQSDGLTLFGEFYENNELVDTIDCEWTVLCDFKDNLIITTERNTLNIKTDNELLIGRVVKVILSDINNEYKSDEVLISIVNYY